MTINYTEQRKTAIIPVLKSANLYSISVAPILWNEIQVLLLEGAITKKITLEFKIEELKADDAK